MKLCVSGLMVEKKFDLTVLSKMALQLKKTFDIRSTLKLIYVINKLKA
jgi:hypothetical protein